MTRDEEFETLMEDLIKEEQITGEQAEKIIKWWQERPVMDSKKDSQLDVYFKNVSEWMQRKPEGINRVFPGIESSSLPR
jgi:hypothetical protein